MDQPLEPLRLRTSESLAARFKTPQTPSYALAIGAGHAVVSRLRNTRPMPGISQSSPPHEAYSFLVPLAPARFAHATVDGRQRPFIQIPGEVSLFDLTSTSTIDLQTLFDNVRFYFSRAALDELAADKGLKQTGSILPRRVDDPLLFNLARAIAPMLLRPHELGSALIEHLLLAVHDHLVGAYAAQPAHRGLSRGGLAQWQVRRVKDFIEAHLADDPSLAALARECGLSASYFVKAFRVSFGTSPHKWITARRIARAKTLLAFSDHGLTEIALLCGFADHSHFSQTFRRSEGETPSHWRRRRLS